jgi:hypothetical protein
VNRTSNLGVKERSRDYNAAGAKHWNPQDPFRPRRRLIESWSTWIVLKCDQTTTPVLKQAFNFSDGEEKFVVNAKIGQGILVTQEGRDSFL